MVTVWEGHCLINHLVWTSIDILNPTIHCDDIRFLLARIHSAVTNKYKVSLSRNLVWIIYFGVLHVSVSYPGKARRASDVDKPFAADHFPLLPPSRPP